jgi:hypothetical protein
MPDHDVQILMSPSAYFAPPVRLERAQNAPRPLPTNRGELRRIGIGFRQRPIYTGVRMLRTRPKTCHFLPLFAPGGGHQGRKARDVCPIGTRKSELGGASSGYAEKKWQIRAAKWHTSTALLFTMSRGRAEDEGRRTGIRSTSTSTRTSTSTTQGDDVRLSLWSGEGRKSGWGSGVGNALH